MSEAPLPIHREGLRPAEAEVLRLLAPHASAAGFYLAGGASLALRLAHRRSDDFAWFREADFPDPLGFARDLERKGLPVEVQQTARETLHLLVRGVRLSFFSYKYPLLQPLARWPEVDCALASLEDIAAMKLSALAQRGARKDFHDLEALGRAGFDLARMLTLYRTKYGIRDVGHVLTALTFFDDAERDPAPVLDAKTDWGTVKATLRGWVRRYAA